MSGTGVSISNFTLTVFMRKVYRSEGREFVRRCEGRGFLSYVCLLSSGSQGQRRGAFKEHTVGDTTPMTFGTV